MFLRLIISIKRKIKYKKKKFKTSKIKAELSILKSGLKMIIAIIIFDIVSKTNKYKWLKSLYLKLINSPRYINDNDVKLNPYTFHNGIINSGEIIKLVII